MSQLNKWMRASFGIAIALIPFQLNLLVYQGVWGRGFINPYTSIWFSASEFFLLITGILFLFYIKKEQRKIRVGHMDFFSTLLCILSITCLSLFTGPLQNSTFSFLIFIKLLEAILIYLLVVNNVLKARSILEIFIISMSVQALIAIFQVVLQQDLGLQLLGEPQLSAETAHIARFTFGETTIIRGYGTFPHPNMLGGFLLISILFSLLFSPHLKHERLVLVIIQFLGLLASFSRSASITFLIAIIIITLWYFNKVRKKNKLLPITLITLFTVEFLFLAFSRGFNILRDPAILERIEGYKIAIKMFFEYPFGVGINRFTLFLDQINSTALMPWDYQPVHNIFLLVLSETGIFGLIAAFGITAFILTKLHNDRKKLLNPEQQFKKRIFLVITISIFIMGLSDHYFLSLNQGRILLVIIFALFSNFNRNPRHILPIKKGGSLNKILADRG